MTLYVLRVGRHVDVIRVEPLLSRRIRLAACCSLRGEDDRKRRTVAALHAA